MQDFSGTERYEVRQRLGQGGMGVVYEAFDRRRERAVAMKVLRDPERGSLYRFKREFRAAADLLHPNLVRLFDLGVLPQGGFFFTMELLAGQPLSAFAYVPSREDPSGLAETLQAPTSPSRSGAAWLETPALVRLLAGVAEGLAFLHRARKVHRDLKPSNVMVDPRGEPKLLDFGILRELDAPGALTATHGAIGTPLYMAPEQVSGRQVGCEADLYSLGCVLYELLCGQPPFQGPPPQVLMRHLSEAPTPPSALRPCDGALEALCLSLLSKDPAARPDAAGVLARLHALGGPVPRPALRAPAVTPGLLGREAERAALARAREEAEAAPRVVLLGGESGAGKSALLAELAATAQTAGAGVWLGRCYEREQVPYKAFDALVDALALDLARRGDAGAPLAAAQKLLPAGTQALARLFPVLREAPAVRRLADETALGDAKAERRRATGALFGLLRGLSPNAPILLLDDLQWADPESLEVLSWLAEDGEAPPCLVVGAYRPEEVPEGHALRDLSQSAGGRVSSLALAPLPGAALEELVAAYSTASLSEENRRQLALEARGNPFLAVELARALREDPAAQGALPTVAELVARRLLRVGEAARGVLSAAAVAGGRSTFPLLAAATGLSPAALAEALDELLRAELLREAPGPRGEEAYDLAHDRFRQAAYEQIPKQRRAALHRALAEHLGAAEDAARAVEHWRRAEEPARAKAAAFEAARRAEAQLAFDRAAELYALAEGTIPAHDLAAARAAALTKAGRHSEAAAAFTRAAEAAEAACHAHREAAAARSAAARSAYDEPPTDESPDAGARRGEPETTDPLPGSPRRDQESPGAGSPPRGEPETVDSAPRGRPGDAPRAQEVRPEGAARAAAALAEAREARLCAATEHIAAGHIEAGLAGFEALLAARGERLHRGRLARLLFVVFGLAATMLSWALWDLLGRLGVRRSAPRPDPEARFRMRLYEAIHSHLLPLEPLVATEFGIRHAALARRLGAPAELGRAYIGHAVRAIALLGGRAPSYALRFIHRGEALCAEEGDYRGLLDGQHARGLLALLEANWYGTRQAARAGEELARRGGLFAEPILMLTRTQHLCGEYFSGDLPALAEHSQTYLADARARGNTRDLADPLLLLGLVQLARGEEARGRASIEEALATLPEEPYTLPRLRGELIALDLDLCARDAAGGLARLEETRRRWRRAGLVTSSIERSMFEVQRARLRLLTGDGLSLGLAPRFGPTSLRITSLRLRAAAALRRGRVRRALAHLERSLRLAERSVDRLGMALALAARASVRRRHALPGADLDRGRARGELEALSARARYILQGEGWDDPTP